MALESETEILDRPQVYLLRMMVFTILVAIVAAVLYPQIKLAFMANPGLNGLIVFVLLMGVIYAFRMVWRLFPEVNWVNSFRIADPGLEVPYTPRLLAPMSTLLRDRHGSTMLSPLTMRSLLDSLASRLDESRDISRYLIGLLIFLGLLGTFWGLLDTVNSVGQVIRQLDVATADSNTIFEELKAGLEAPLSAMGTSCSSSRVGLAGSLVLGFLDLQARQAQNRFSNDLEDWLSTITDIAAGGGQLGVPQYLRMDMNEIQESIDKVNSTLEDALSDAGPPGAGEEGEAENMGKLAEAVGGLVHQMREEQKIMRQWAQEQSDQTAHISKTLGDLSSKTSTTKARSSAKSEKDK